MFWRCVCEVSCVVCVRSAAVACVGAFYERMGRMLGSSFPETINNLLKALKSAEVMTFHLRMHSNSHLNNCIVLN